MRWIKLWAPVAGIALFMVLLSHMSHPPRPSGVADWLLHGLEYAALGFALLRALGGGLRLRVPWKILPWALALGILFGALDEFHQSFIPFRQADLKDLAADAAGTLAGAVIAVFVSGSLAGARTESRAAAPALSLTLVTGPGCPLCEEARVILERIRQRISLCLEERSIADEPELMSLYGEQIPVVLVNGRRVANGRVDEGRLVASLKSRVGRPA
ncbi:MAG: VanZ family protein [Acidobacteriota bacterium]